MIDEMCGTLPKQEDQPEDLPPQVFPSPTGLSALIMPSEPEVALARRAGVGNFKWWDQDCMGLEVV